MCSLHSYDKENDKSTYEADFGGGIPLPDDSTIKNLVSLCVSINFIDTWPNVLSNIFTCSCCAYQDNRK